MRCTETNLNLLDKYNDGQVYQISLFSGALGGDLATVHFLGWRPVLYVEWDEYCQKVIQQRIRDGLMPDAPIWGDIRTLRSTVLRPYREMARRYNVVLTAGFPCQPFSTAGRRKGKDDSRNMWPDTIRIIREVRPRWVLLENVSGLRCCRRKKTDPPSQEASYLGTVLGDLAESGYDARWKVLSAAEVGAPHKRDRIWIVAHTTGEGWTRNTRSRSHTERRVSEQSPTVSWWSTEPGLDRVVNGMAHRVDRLKAIGNGQVSLVVSTVWDLLTGGLDQ